jgi:hypothetical protein
MLEGKDDVILHVGILNDMGSTTAFKFDNHLILLDYNPQTCYAYK